MIFMVLSSIMEHDDDLNPSHRGSNRALVSVAKIDFDRWRARGRTVLRDGLSTLEDQNL